VISIYNLRGGPDKTLVVDGCGNKVREGLPCQGFKSRGGICNAREQRQAFRNWGRNINVICDSRVFKFYYHRKLLLVVAGK